MVFSFDVIVMEIKIFHIYGYLVVYLLAETFQIVF